MSRSIRKDQNIQTKAGGLRLLNAMLAHEGLLKKYPTYTPIFWKLVVDISRTKHLTFRAERKLRELNKRFSPVTRGGIFWENDRALTPADSLVLWRITQVCWATMRADTTAIEHHAQPVFESFGPPKNQERIDGILKIMQAARNSLYVAEEELRKEEEFPRRRAYEQIRFLLYSDKK